ncbi:MAG: hypothetical protein COZ85_03685 [Candidatus Moranbacteria bacterium CG_4_8_14_3_um_filter_34_16]|nr:MAG: hypothetical protein COT31_02430 [Candidatus Moranbacteria bacterium CG08_land_8_20_14_0_20_34_16]PIW94726.1 MAG: hypothetical protein COZ85_03685 [Candidatus Moranbacteria bacterium CG_4_8_14_3_um_filter_34_16]
MDNQNQSEIEREQEKNNIEKKITEILDKMGFLFNLEMKESEEDEKTQQKNLICNIKTQESNYLIGQHGVNLQALQHISRIIIRKQLDSKTDFILDVNFYRQEKNKSIIEIAKNIANQAIMEKKSFILRPMSPYERRLVHLELSKNKEVSTESIGEGEDRRIVIKPIGLI